MYSEQVFTFVSYKGIK